jgi:WhiB family redox-sensing transcriptional regulator
MLSSGSACSAASWMALGACHDEDPELFFPIGATGPSLRQISAAKAVCGRCTVRAACLSHALSIMPEGIWGGSTQEERHAIRHSPGHASEHAAVGAALHAAERQVSLAGREPYTSHGGTPRPRDSAQRCKAVATIITRAAALGSPACPAGGAPEAGAAGSAPVAP